MKIIPIKTERVEPNPSQEFSSWIENQLKENEQSIQEGDILVVSSKIVSYFEKRVLDYDWIKPSTRAKVLAKKMKTSEGLMELVLLEADEVIRETKWVLLTRKNGILCPNSGVDTSNTAEGTAVLWPKKPFESAETLQSKLKKNLGIKKIAVIITDSNCLPGRSGTTAVAIGYEGLEGYENLKGAEDLFGNTLKYSALNRVDSLATAANLVMGESNEMNPLAIIRGYEWEATTTKNDEMIISSSDDIYDF